MRRNWIIGLISAVLLLSGTLGTVGAVNKSYELVADEFITEVAVDDDLNYDDMYIVESNAYGSKEVPVTKDMIVEGDNTSQVGKKTLVIKYSKQEFLVEYIVKYRVKFMVGKEIISTQMILSTDELQIPEDPKLAGNEFLGWSPEIPEIINRNMVFDADFTDKPQEVPALKPIVAVYGDKLSSIELPSNQYGAWKFVDDLDATVGNAGINKFEVEFHPTNPELAKVEGEVTINVDKKELEFKNLVTEFAYDGKSHKPTYDLDVNVKVEYFGPNPSEIGSYVYTLEIVDDNYKGYMAGSFEITKPVVTITVKDITINLGDAIPEIEYTVEGIDSSEINSLGIKTIKPNVLHAGEYTLTVSWTNTNYKVKVIEGKLTVNKVNIDLLDPKLVSDAVYGSKLSTVEFDNINPNGTWSWKNPDEIISTHTEYKAVAVFTPNDLGTYEIVERTIYFDVEKKTLEVKVIEDTFDYNYGKPIQVIAQVEDGSYEDIKLVVKYTDKTLEGDPVNAGSYNCVVEIDDLRYQGKVEATLTIEKINYAFAEGENPFDRESFVVDWKQGLILSDVILPENCKWDEPNTSLDLCKDGQVFAATYYPEDSTNFNVVKGTFVVDVKKIQTEIKGLPSSGYYGDNPDDEVVDGRIVYNGNARQEEILKNIRLNHSEKIYINEELKDFGYHNFEYYFNGEKVDDIKEAGKYTVNINVSDSEHYLGTTTTIIVYISKSGVETPLSREAVYGQTLADVKLPDSNYGTWTWLDPTALVGDVNETANEHYALFTPYDEYSENYEAFEAKVDVVVNKKELFINVLEHNYIYEEDSTFRVIYTLTDAPIGEDGSSKDKDGVEYSSYIKVNGSDQTLINAGSVQITLYVDEENYKSANEIVILKVAKKGINLPGKDTTEFKYDHGNDITYTLIENEDDKSLYTVKGNVKTTAGTTNVEITLNDPNNYEWIDNESVVTYYYEFKVAKGDFNVVLPDNLTAIYGQTLKDIKLPEVEGGSWVWRDETQSVGNATKNDEKSQFKAIFKVDDKDNYVDNVEYTLVVEVNKAKVELDSEININNLEYIGSSQKQVLNISKDSLYEIYENNGGEDVGEYSVTFKLKNFDNYEWAETENEYVIENEYLSVTYYITQSQTEISSLTIEGWNYGDSSKNPVIDKTWYAEVRYEYSIDNSTWLTIDEMNFEYGDYYVRAIIDDTTNYLGVTSESCKFTVSKKVEKTPAFSSEVQNILYDGNSHTMDIADNDLYTVVKNDGGIEVGQYPVVLKLKDSKNHKWENSETDELTIYFNIVKDEDNYWVEKPLVLEEYTYSQFEAIGTATAKYGEVIIEYSVEGSEYTTEMPKEVGEYFVRFKVIGTNDYNGITSNAFKFEIVPFEVTKPAEDKTVFTYNGKEQKYNVATSTYYSVSGNTQTDAKEYTVIIKLNDSKNYVWSDGTNADFEYKFVINRKQYIPEELPTNLTATYGQTLKDVTFDAHKDGSWSWDNSELSVGTVTEGRLFNATFTVTEAEKVDNYIDYTCTLSVKVNKKGIDYTNEISNHIYDNQLYVPTVLNATNYEVYENEGGTNVGQYFVTFVLKDFNNYKWNNSEDEYLKVSYNITQAQSQITSLSIEDFEYGKSPDPKTVISNYASVRYEYSIDNSTWLTIDKINFEYGDYYVRAIIDETENYLGTTSEPRSFTVLKKSLNPTFEPEILSVPFDNEHHTMNITDTELYTVKENVGGKEAGKYPVVLKLKDSKNYRWQNSETDELTIYFNIVKDEDNYWVELPSVNSEGYTYSQFETIGNAKAKYGEVKIEYSVAGLNEYTTEMPTEVGDYSIRFSVVATESYIGIEAYSLLFSINPFEVTKPAEDTTVFTYNGKEQKYNVATSTYYSVSGNTQTDANEYTVSIKLNDSKNYVWSDGTNADFEYKFVINKQIVTAPIDVNAVYTGNPILDGITESELYSFESLSETNVCEKTINVTLIDSNNYKWSSTEEAIHVVNYVITKAQAEITEFTVEDIIYKENLDPKAKTNFGSVVFTYSENLNGEYDLIAPTNAGTYYVKASVEGNDNYYGAISNPIEVKINPFGLDKPTADSTVFTYNGEEQTYELAENENYTISGNVKKNKGTYNVIVTLKPNYCWKDDNSLEPLSFVFEIKQATNEWTTVPTMSGWTYGEAGAAGTAESKFGNVVVEYKPENGEYSTTLPTNAGNYVARFTVVSTTNYTELTKEIPFTVAKKVVIEPTIASKVYTGERLSADIEETDDYTVTTNAGGINVGNYDVVLSLVDSTNYKWNDVDTASKTFTFAITKAQAEITNLSITGWAYLEDANEPTASTNFGTITYTYIINGAEGTIVPTLPGTYTVKATIADDTNYDGDVAETTVTITKAIVQVPTVGSKSYTGETQTSGLTTNEIYKVVDAGGIDKGEYTATLTLVNSDLYQWSSDANAESVTVKYNIVAEENEWTVEPSVSSSIVYGNELTITGTPKFGELVIEYKLTSEGDAAYSTTQPTNVGTYDVKFTVAADAEGSYGGFTVYKQFKITKAQVAIPTPDNTQFVYNGEEQTYTIAVNENYTVEGNVQTNANETGYTVTVTLKDTDNFEWTDETIAAKTYTFIIKKADYEPTGIATAETAIYGETLKEIPISYSETDGTLTWLSESDSVGTVGIQTHKALFTPTNTNYNTSEVAIMVTVTKATNGFTADLAMAGWTYNETAQNPSATTAFGEVQYKYYDEQGNELSGKPTNAGTYTVVAYVADSSANYTDIQSEAKQFVIEQATPIVTWPTGLSAEWGQNLTSIVLPEKFSWKEDETIAKNIGTFSYDMVYTPEDIVNYKTLTQSVSVQTTKKTTEITNINTTFDYVVGNSGFNLGITHNNTDSNANLEVTYTYCATKDGTYTEHTGAIINAGYYKVTMSMIETDYYNALETTECTVVVNKAKEQIFDEKKTEYGETVESNLPTSIYGEWTYSEVKQEVASFSTETVLRSLGRIKLTATFTPFEEYAANFAVVVKDVYLVVEARTLTIKVTGNEFVYNGKNQKLTYQVFDKDTLIDIADYEITISGNAGLTEVGSKELTLEVSGSDYFRGSVKATITITKATVTVPTIAAKTYNTELQTADIATDDLYEIVNKGGTNAGTYPVTLTLTDHHNYKWSTATENIDPESVTLDFVINKANIDMSKVTWNYSKEIAYTGEEHTVSVINLPEEIDSENTTYVGNAYMEVGNYNATVKFAYDTANYNIVSNMTLSWSIVKATPVISNFVLVGWTYGDTTNVPSADSTFGGVTFTYSETENGVYVEKVPTNAGTYYVKASVAGTKNWNAVEQIIPFTINQREVEVDWITLDSYVYQGVDAQAFVNPTASVTDINGKVISLTVTIADNKVFKNAGEYTFNATTNNEDLIANYILKDNSKSITVDKATLEIGTISDKEITWESDLLLSHVTLEPIKVSGVTFTPSWVSDQTLYDCDEKSYNVTYEPNNKNYYDVNTTVKVKVLKKTVTITASDITQEYNKNAVTVIATDDNEETNEINYTYYLNEVEVNEILNAGTYTVVIEVPATEHYQAASKEINVTITKVEVEIPEIESTVYNGSSQTANISSTEIYTVENVNETNAGTYPVTLTLREPANYKWVDTEESTVTVSFEIQKANYDLSGVKLNNTTFNYDGKEKEVALIGLPEGVEITEYVNNKATNKGTYSLSVSKYTYDDTNYNLIKFGTYTWSIESVNAEITSLSIEDWSYGDTPSTPEATYNVGTIKYTYSNDGINFYSLENMTFNVGTYTLKATIDSTSNYAGTEKTTTFEVVPCNLTVQWVTLDSYVYQGSSSSPFNNPEAYVMIGETKVSLNVTKETAAQFKNHGDYEFTATLIENGNVNNTNYTLLKNEKVITVDKAELEIETPIYTVIWNENLTLNSIDLGTINYADTTVTPQLKSNDSVSLNICQIYEFEVTFIPADNNYNSLEGIIKVDVEKSDNFTVTTEKAIYEKSYDESAFTITAETSNSEVNNEEYKLSYTYYNDSEYQEYLDGTSAKPEALEEIVIVGEYIIEITSPETDHYVSKTTTVKVNIKKGNISYTAPTLEADYYSTLSSVDLPESLGGKAGTFAWTVENPEEIKLSTQADANKYSLVFTPDNTNYNTITISNVIINLSKVLPEVNYANGIPSVTYTGSVISLESSWFVVTNPSSEDCSITVQVSSTSNIITVGTHTITVTITEGTTYQAYSGEFNVKVTPKPIDPNNLTATATYGQTLGDAKCNLTNGTLTFANPNQSVGNVIAEESNKLVVNATFTPTDSTNFTAAQDSYQITITVNKAQAEIDTDSFKLKSETFTYSPNPVEFATATSNFGTVKFMYSTDEVNYVSLENMSFDAGQTYYVKAVVNSDSNIIGTEVCLDTPFTVTKATVTITAPTLADKYYEDRIENVDLGATGKATITTFEGKTIEIEGTFDYVDPVFPSGATSELSNVNVSLTFNPTTPDSYTGTYAYNFIINPITIEVPMSAVAYSSGKYYGTIEDALNKVASGTIYVVVDSDPIVKSDIVIASGVTLSIPYSGELYNEYYYEGGNVGIFACDNADALLKTDLTINKNVEITVKGSIIVGGKMSPGNGSWKYSGQTAFEYSQITMGQGASIQNYGSIECYGYIMGDSSAQVISHNGSSTIMPYIVFEHRGGTIFSEMVGGMLNAVLNPKLTTAAFNRQKIMMNIQSVLLQLNYGALLIGKGCMHANDVDNKMDVNLVGTSSSYMYQLTDNVNSYINARYNHATEVLKWDVYGGANYNPMDIKVKVATGDINLSTKDVFSPLTYLFDITLNVNSNNNQKSAVYEFKNDVKLLPGAKLTVGVGCTLNIRNIIVYSHFEDVPVGNTAENVYPTDKGDAELIINGTLNCDSIGGLVKSEVSGATLNITTGTTLTSKEIISADPTYKDYTENLRFKHYDDKQIKEATVDTYYSKDGEWFPDSVTITYINNGTTTTEEYSIDANGLSLSRLEKPTQTGYEFSEWHYDKGLADKVSASKNIYVDTTLYGELTIIKYTINYIVTKDDNINETYTIPEDLTKTFNVETSINVYIPTFGTYAFNGWCTNEELTAYITDYSFNSLVGVANEENEITLYGKWLNEIYIINYDFGEDPNNLGTTTEGSVSKYATTFTPQTATGGDTNTSLQYYFGGWYLTKTINDDGSIDYSNPIDGSITLEELKTYITNDEVTIYAKWNEKVSVIISLGENCPDSSLNVNGATSSKTGILYYKQSLLNDYIANTSFVAGINSNTAMSHYFNGWTVNGVALNVDNTLTDAQISTATSNGTITVTANWIQKISVITSLGTNCPDSTLNVNGATSSTPSTLYYMSTQLNEYVVNTDFAANIRNDVTKSHYFDKWTVNGVALNVDNTLTDAQISTAISNGTITVSGNWLAKCQVTISIVKSGWFYGPTSATYETFSISQGGSGSFYVVKNQSITITGKKNYGQSVSSTSGTVSASSNTYTLVLDIPNSDTLSVTLS